jgi:hypothetical protein
VIDSADYLAAFERWFRVLEEHRIYRDMVPGLRRWWSAVDQEGLPARGKVSEFCRRMPRLEYREGLAITKSNLLYRMLYLGEPLRQRPCPGVKLNFGEKGFRHHPFLECRCGGCRWLP